MTTRRTSNRNLQQLAAQAQSDDLNEVDQIRYHDLNCEKGHAKKKIRSCNANYQVTGEEKEGGGNQVFSFSTAIYDL